MRSGDAFLRCSDGQTRWGIFGAAGVVFVCVTDQGSMVLLQRRSLYSHDGGTWSCAGGALDELEDPLEGALREAWEEIGPIPTHRVVGSFVFQPATDWAYTTFVVQVDEQFDTMPNFESEEITWIAIDSVPQLSLHRGFSAAWPHLAALVQSVGIAG